MVADFEGLDVLSYSNNFCHAFVATDSALEITEFFESRFQRIYTLHLIDVCRIDRRCQKANVDCVRRQSRERIRVPPV